MGAVLGAERVDMTHDKVLWCIGQGLSVVAGIAIAKEHGAAIGVAVAYALLLLVDIRLQTAPNAGVTGAEPKAERPR